MKLIPITLLLLLVLIMSQNVSAQVEVEANVDSDINEPIASNVTDLIYNQFGNDPDPVPTGETIRQGWGDVPEEYKNSNDSAYTCLIVGAQYVASQAVLKNIFANSLHNVTQVYSSEFKQVKDLETISSEQTSEEVLIETENGELEYIDELGTEDNFRDEGYYYYTYDVELTDTQNRSLRTNFTVKFRYWDQSFTLLNFSFVYTGLIGDQQEQIQLNWFYNGQSDNIGNYTYTLYNGDKDYPSTYTITEDNLPNWGENITTPDFMERLGYNVTELDEEDGYQNWIMQAGNNFAWIHMSDLPFSTDINNWYMNNKVYAFRIADNAVRYFMESYAGSDDGSFVTTYSELIWYSDELKVEIFSWAVNEYVGVSYTFG